MSNEDIINGIPLPVPLPELPTADYLLQTQEEQRARAFLADDQWLDIDISKDWLDPNVQYQNPDYTLKIGGVPVCPLGDIHGLTAQAGNGNFAVSR